MKTNFSVGASPVFFYFVLVVYLVDWCEWGRWCSVHGFVVELLFLDVLLHLLLFVNLIVVFSLRMVDVILNTHAHHLEMPAKKVAIRQCTNSHIPNRRQGSTWINKKAHLLLVCLSIGLGKCHELILHPGKFFVGPFSFFLFFQEVDSFTSHQPTLVTAPCLNLKKSNIKFHLRISLREYFSFSFKEEIWVLLPCVSEFEW